MEPRSAISVHDSFELQIYRAPIRSNQLLWPSSMSSTMQRARLSPLTSLPWELQLMIISYLDVRGAIHLRKTCRLYYRYLTVPVIERLFTENRYINFDLLNCCIDCLSMPSRGCLVQDEYSRAGIWRSMCFRCWRVKRSPGFLKEPKHRLRYTDGREGYACLLCGWPIRHDKRHARCIRTVGITRSALVLLSTGNFVYVLMLTTMFWMNYPHDTMLVTPSVLNFVLSLFIVALLTTKYTYYVNTSYIRIPLELASTVIWTPPVLYCARGVSDGVVKWNSYPIYIWIIFSARMLGHILNWIGLAMLDLGYDPRSPFLPNLPRWKKVLFIFCSFLAWWAQAKYDVI
ncbi:hypothetical protein F4806DRAFT_104889 [Annulohypoxylon nitens]|nr:hypothetical protein F4806DRAFT_104889 [Annulohypoxylon nitens]